MRSYKTKDCVTRKGLGVTVLLWLTLVFSSTATVQATEAEAVLIHAARLFDGHQMRTNTSVLIEAGRITRVDLRDKFVDSNVRQINLGDATLLPGFIELHAHLGYRDVPAEVVLSHGITTLRDVGGPLHKPYGGDGSLRVLTSGPIITGPNGYPIPKIGTHNIAIPVATEDEARKTVRDLIAGGAVVIKIALEPGGEKGAPWSGGHHHPGHQMPHAKHAKGSHADDQHKSDHHKPDHHKPDHHKPDHHKPDHHSGHAQKDHAPHNKQHGKPSWPLLSENIVKAIVDEAHQQGRKVTAHIGEEIGAKLALDAGVDEWAHMPCAAIPESLLQQAVAQKVTIVTTIDTLSKCEGVAQNAKTFGALGAELLYGAEIAHPDIPWGIDVQELMYMMQMTGMQTIDVLRAATSKSGAYLGIPQLGTLAQGAPADMIAIKGNPLHSLKALEYPGLVISGGKVVVNRFNQ